jgi:predicted RNA-binding Zn ribbon-like protein
VAAVDIAGVYDAGPQSGGRQPAPGRLALAQAFVNSFFDFEYDWGADRFATADGLAAWMGARGLEPGAVSGADRRRAVAVREGLRALLREHNGEARDDIALAALSEAADGVPVAMRVDDAGRTEPGVAVPGVRGALGLVLAVVHESRADGTWERLKICPGHHCGWAFYDRSLNQGSTWCSARVCGAREKARAYRRRTSSATS